MKTVRRDVIEALFKNPSETQEFFAQWIKCFTCFSANVRAKITKITSLLIFSTGFQTY